MARRPCTFRQRDVTRALRGVKAAGIEIYAVEIKAGAIILITTKTGANCTVEDMDAELAAFIEAKHG
jgi:hypothetical protein